MTFLYGDPQYYLQKHLPKEISTLNNRPTKPWLIIGDLNKLSSIQEKVANNKVILLDIINPKMC